MSRSNLLRLFGLVAVVAAVAILSCLAVFYAFIRPQITAHRPPETFIEHLELSEEIRERVEAIDRRFEEDRQRLLAEFGEATRGLASLLEREDRYSEEVSESIHEIHRIHGELQALSIRRYFALLEVLPPEQQAELRRLASEALSQPR